MAFLGFNDTSAAPTLTINSTDYSPWVVQWQIDASILDATNPQARSWEGTITLGTASRYNSGLVTPPDFDPATNSDFVRGLAVVLTPKGAAYNLLVLDAEVSARDGGTLAATEVELRIGCKLALIDSADFPENVTQTRSTRVNFNKGSGSSIQTFTTNYQVWTDAIAGELTAAKKADGTPWLTSGDYDFSGISTTLNGSFAQDGSPLTDGYTANQSRDRNPLVNAQRIATNRGYFLYQDLADGVIKLTGYPINGAGVQPAKRLALAQMLDAGFTAGPRIDEPVEKVLTQTTSMKRARPADEGGDEEDMQSYPITIPLAVAPSPGTGEEIVVCERIEQRPSDGSTWTQDYRIRARRFWLLPRDPSDLTAANVNTAWATVCQATITRTYNSLGLPLTNNDVQANARCVEIDEKGLPVVREEVQNTSYYGDLTLVAGQGTRESWTYGPTGVPAKRRKDWLGQLFLLSLSETAGAVEADPTAIRTLRREDETNTYRDSADYWQIITYQVAEMAVTGNNDDTGLIRDPDKEGVARRLDGIPKPDAIRPPTEPVTPDVYSAEAEVTSNYGKGRKTQRLSGGGTAKIHAKNLARFELAVAQQGAITWQCSRVLDEGEVIQPYRVEHIGGVAIVCDGDSLEFGQDGQLKLNYLGRQCGVLAEAVTVEKRPFSSSATLTAGPMPDLA